MDATRLQQVQEANTINSTVAVNLQIENNQKLLNNIYLNTVAKDIDTFTSTQLANLYYLAFQCPLSGGPAVYRSRSLLSKIIDTFYNDHEICAAAGIAYKKEQESKLKDSTLALNSSKLQIHTFPNPANNYLLIQSNISSDDNLTARVYDIVGRMVKEQTLLLSNRKFRLNTQDLPAGMFFLRIVNGKESLYSTKFNIQH